MVASGHRRDQRIGSEGCRGILSRCRAVLAGLDREGAGASPPFGLPAASGSGDSLFAQGDQSSRRGGLRHAQPTNTQPRPRPGLLGPGLLAPGGFCGNDTSTRHRVKYIFLSVAVSRVIAYIDGFNLYHGLRDAGLKDSRWLNLQGVCVSLLRPDEQLELVRYFTSWVKGNPVKAARQTVYVDALRARGGLEIDFGHFLSNTARCFRCGNVWKKNEEKKTDVNIAVRLLEDASDDRFDTAIVVSGDSDLVPPIESCSAPLPTQACNRCLPSTTPLIPARAGRFCSVVDLSPDDPSQPPARSGAYRWWRGSPRAERLAVMNPLAQESPRRTLQICELVAA